MQEPILKKNQQIELEIIDIAHDGNGIARWNGIAVFVPHTAVGDRITAKVVKVNKSHGFAVMINLLAPSPSRKENDCPVFEKCGGCSLRHLQYEEELRIKGRWIVENMRRIGGIELENFSVLPSPQIAHYRNKSQLPVTTLPSQKCIAGFYANRSHRVIPSTGCQLQPPFFDVIVQTVLSYLEENGIATYDETTNQGMVRHIYIRYGEKTGEVMVCLVTTQDSLPNQEQLVSQLLALPYAIVSILFNVNRENTNVILGKESKVIYGKEGIADVICDISVEISSQAFYQVNRAAAEQLYQSAFSMAELQGDETVVELYCGAGTISLAMASQVKEVIAVEIVPEAVENAKSNAQKNGIANVHFLCADATQAVTQLVEKGTHCDMVVVDPPRKGCHLSVLQSIVQLTPKKILYISCNSATLARDCKILTEAGYCVSQAQGADLFPRTNHVECCVLLTQSKP